MNLIIVGGATSTGKSTLAQKLAKDLKVSAFLRDAFKEKQFDAHGGKPTLRHMVKIESASYKELASQITSAQNLNTDLIIESNFKYKERSKLQKLISGNTNIIEIFCYARGRIILKRYAKRYRSGERHPGHRDYLWHPIVAYESLGRMKWRYQPFKLSDHTKVVNTDDFTAINYPEILKYVRSNQI